MKLAYCTNVVAGSTLEQTCCNVEQTFGAVREKRGGTEKLPIGLWLSAVAAHQLSESIGGPTAMRDRLGDAGLEIVTLNAFPYQDFHSAQVKHRVYEPSWANMRRALYTAELADLATELAPPGTQTISLSTLPIGWRASFHLQGCGANLGLASAIFEQTVRHLAALETRTGIRVTVDLEPEPGCVLDRASDVVSFFEHVLLQRRGDGDPRRYIGVCHDICHAAVMFEDQQSVLRQYRAAGISVNKVQISSALVASGSSESLQALRAFVEPRWLHQTSVRHSDGSIRFFEDLPVALEENHPGEWRTHFHVPVFASHLGVLSTSQSAIQECLSELAHWPVHEQPILELETYAWDALPESARNGASLVDGISREISWCTEQLTSTQQGVQE